MRTARQIYHEEKERDLYEDTASEPQKKSLLGMIVLGAAIAIGISIVGSLLRKPEPHYD